MVTVVEKKLDERKAYWRTQLSGPLPALALPLDHPRPPVPSFNRQTESVTLDDKFRDRIKSLVSSEKTSLSVVLLAAFKMLLFRYTGQQDLIVGSLMQVEKDNQVVKESITNLVALRIRVSDGSSAESLIALIDKTVKEAGQHIDYPFEAVIDAIEHGSNRDGMPLFNTAFVFGESLLWGSDFEQYLAECDLVFLVNEEDAGLRLSWQYDADLFEPETIRRMLGHVQVVLDGLVANPKIRLSVLPLLTDAERHQLLVGFNDTQMKYPTELCLHELFEAQVQRTPEAVALVFEGKSLTYKGLNDRSNQLAHHLRGIGVREDVCVGVFMERSLDMVVALYAILKAGGAYVPLDPMFPPDRLASMLEDAQVPVLLTQQSLLDALPNHNARCIAMDSDWGAIEQESAENLAISDSSTSLAYVIFTSGSTGRPKGVQIPHRAVVNFLCSMRREPGLTENDFLIAVTTLSFDIAVLELFLPAVVGGRVEIVSREVAYDGVRLSERLDKSGATVMQATPATWRLLLQAGWKGNKNLTILCGGEALPRELAAELLDKCDSLWNMYGPTETTVWSTRTKIESADKINIGRPISNTQILILDKEGQPVPIGVGGELHIGGAGLARSYLNRPELTSEKFIRNPFGNVDEDRMYKTGDLARWLPDGNIEFLGRIDYQVKIRGFRVELGEIEAVLERHLDVEHALLVARDDTPLMTQLAAYIIPRDKEKQPEMLQTTLSSKILRSYLRQYLPDYMVPASFTFLESLPLQANGKINRRALPAPSEERQAEEPPAAPSNELEERIARTWKAALKIETVGVQDNFFDLGGHSLLLGMIHGELRSSVSRDLRLVDLYTYPTIRSVARFLQNEDRNTATERALSRAKKQLNARRRQRPTLNQEQSDE